MRRESSVRRALGMSAMLVLIGCSREAPNRLDVKFIGNGSGQVRVSPLPEDYLYPTCKSSQSTYGCIYQQSRKSGLITSTLTATADPGSVFIGWTGACTGSDPCDFPFDGKATVVAEFKKIDYGNLTASDSFGNAFLSGTFFQTTSVSGKNLMGVGDVDLYLAKYDTAHGALLWAITFGSTKLDFPSSMTVDPMNDLLVTAHMEGTLLLPDGSPLQCLGNSEVLAKFSGSNGALLWANCIAI